MWIIDVIKSALNLDGSKNFFNKHYKIQISNKQIFEQRDYILNIIEVDDKNG